MISPSDIWISILPVFLLLGIGAGLRRAGVLKADTDAPLMRMVLYLLMPSLILDNILGNPGLKEGGIVLWAVALGFTLIVAATALGYLLGPLAGLHRGEGRRTFAVSAGLQNYGYIAIPVLVSLFGDRANLGVLFVHSLGVELALWTVGILLMAGRSTASWRLLLNGPVIAIVAGIVLNFLGLGEILPGFARETMHSIGLCAIPMGILLCGMTIGDLLSGWRPLPRVGLLAVLVRLALAPALFLAALALLPVPEPLARVLVVQAAMPAGIFPIVMARHFGGHPSTAIQVVLFTTVVSLFTIPPFLAWATEWLGLL